MQRFAVLLTLAALTGCAAVPAEQWRPRDTALELSWQVLNAADAHTTNQAMDDCPTAYEANPIARQLFGARPAARDVLMVSALGGVAHWAVARLLPPKWRTYWQGGFVGLSAGAVAHNVSAACHP